MSAVFIMGADQNGKKIKLDANVNVQALQALANNPILEENEKKFNKLEKKANIKLQLTLDSGKEISTSLSDYKVSIKGNIKLDQAYPFEGEGDLQLYRFDNREVYYGAIDVNMKNVKGNDEGVVSLRYEPQTEKLDISVTSGAMGDTAMIPFGTPFLTIDDLTKIDTIKEEVTQ
ncbi:hypothetical protein [Paenibacillus sp. JJ-223]|uniref:hypothetical protein n=1 Tax=Paenibacillus sp. JJ-223 TaxID=2905647 RepID=UPI001F281AD0|nr:hypothetical protein [Paenibacillus sp. JJ-223]CAH1192409.1 hypothetical protein PAECIP111890_00737 [Paenibacillus sp. JJ-223]